jgi:hypothetical protein
VTATAIGLLLALVGMSASAAQARLIVGIGDQKTEMFSDPRFARLRIHHARLVVPWDALNVTWQRAEVDAWMQAARDAHVQPLIAFTRSRRARLMRFRPSVARFARTFRKFRRRYPWARVFTPWNEANHCSQPTCRHPRAAAEYYDEMRRQCPRCTIVAADVLDAPNMVAWLRAFRRHVHGRPRLWGLHNYLDVNRFRTSGTRAMLATVPGRVWITEVGGIVSRRPRNPRNAAHLAGSPRHAAEATRWMFHLARLSPRIGRLYVYHWNSLRGPRERWDSGLIDARGRPRPAYRVFVREVYATRRRGR